jgi:rhamnogalacturonyl hydrolase YesR
MRLLLFALLVPFATLSLLAQGPRSEEYLQLTHDGAWCWFSDPRAVYHRGTEQCFYAGWTSGKGDIMVGSYNYSTGKIIEHTIQAGLQKDDHTNPSLLMLPDGRVMVFFTEHNGRLFITTSRRAEDIKEFEPVRTINAGDRVCYTNPVMLSEEKNRIFLFFRGGADSKPTFIASEDLGKTWSAPKTLVKKPGSSPFVRPYMKIVSDGKSKIYFAFTDGHPRDEIVNSIYYMVYQHGVFSDAAGNQLGRLSGVPVDQGKIPRVYDGDSSRVRAWIWDIAITREGMPALVYTTLPEESNHAYNYASWNGKIWVNRPICRAGSWFPRDERPKETPEPEPHYSGGICLDHGDPRVVYLARPQNDVFEIERWETTDEGGHWSHQAITEHSRHDNVRPVVVAGCPAGVIPSVLWMNASKYRHYTDYQATLRINELAPGFPTRLRKADIARVMASAAEWQMAESAKPKHHELDWTNGALYAGIMAWARLDKDVRAIHWLEEIGSRFGWQPYFRMYHADDICVSQTFLDLYRLKTDPQRLNPTKARIDWVCANPSESSMILDYSNSSTTDRWSWCDALYMAPPVYARLAAITGDERYLEVMHREYSATVDLLYDREEHLFHRDHRFLSQREANGRKVFWGRGNGWVMGGLVAILKELEEENKHRAYYVSLFKEMSSKVASVQDVNGFWHASLLDPASYPNPETSCTGFFCYALAYGINAGLLDKQEYLLHVSKAWEALVRSVSADGKLGWVQPIGEDPRKVDRSMTEVYGVGAFLLAGAEIWQLAD